MAGASVYDMGDDGDRCWNSIPKLNSMGQKEVIEGINTRPLVWPKNLTKI